MRTHDEISADAEPRSPAMAEREPYEVYIAEFPCDLHCSIEIDLTDRHNRYGRMQMRGEAEREHEARHAKLAADMCSNLCGTVCTCPESEQP